MHITLTRKSKLWSLSKQGKLARMPKIHSKRFLKQQTLKVFFVMTILRQHLSTSFQSTTLLRRLLFLRSQYILKSTHLHTHLGWRLDFLSRADPDKSFWGQRKLIHPMRTSPDSEHSTKFSQPAEEKLRLSTMQRNSLKVDLTLRRRGSL